MVSVSVDEDFYSFCILFIVYSYAYSLCGIDNDNGTNNLMRPENGTDLKRFLRLIFDSFPYISTFALLYLILKNVFFWILYPAVHMMPYIQHSTFDADSNDLFSVMSALPLTCSFLSFATYEAKSNLYC